MLKLTTILKEDYLRDVLDNPTNRRLLNIIAKNNDLSNIRYNSSNPFLRQMSPIKRFIKDSLFIVDPMKIAELLWIIFLNGDIDYLKDELNTSTDFQVYEVYYYTEMEEEEEDREVDCSDCDGYGQKTEECEMCNGTGEEEEGEDEEGVPIMVDCVDCTGTGEVDNDCDVCAGSGYETEEYIYYEVEEWRAVYLSKDKNITMPPTISYPYESIRTKEIESREPIYFNEWVGYIPKEELILITEEFIDRLTEEHESYVEDESGKINSIESESIDELGLWGFLKHNLWEK